MFWPPQWTLDSGICLLKHMKTRTERASDAACPQGHRTAVAAILPVYTLGIPADMAFPIIALAEEYRLPVASDAAASEARSVWVFSVSASNAGSSVHCERATSKSRLRTAMGDGSNRCDEGEGTVRITRFAHARQDATRAAVQRVVACGGGDRRILHLRPLQPSPRSALQNGPDGETTSIRHSLKDTQLRDR